MEKAKSYRDLLMWQKAHELVLKVYQITKDFPKEETYGLTSQLRRAVVSVPANIAEGFARNSSKEKLRFYNIAAASLSEVNYFLLLSNDLKYANTISLQELAEEVGKIIYGYTKAFQTN